MVREILPGGSFVEIHIDTPLEECERRDPKGLYRKARQGEIPNFTGIDSPYEPPRAPALRLGTMARPVWECADAIIAYLREHGLLPE